MLQEKDNSTETVSLSTVDNDERLLTRLGYKQGRLFLILEICSSGLHLSLIRAQETLNTARAFWIFFQSYWDRAFFHVSEFYLGISGSVLSYCIDPYSSIPSPMEALLPWSGV